MSTSDTPALPANAAAAIIPPDLSALPPTALLDTASTAAALGLKPETLANWRTYGRYDLPYIRSGRLIRYRVADVLGFIERRTRLHTGQTAQPATTA